MKRKLLHAVFTVSLWLITVLVVGFLVEMSDALLKLFYGFEYAKLVALGAGLVLLVALEYHSLNKETPNANT